MEMTKTVVVAEIVLADAVELIQPMLLTVDSAY